MDLNTRKNNQKNFLIISYLYYPSKKIGAQRWTKIGKSLKNKNINWDLINKKVREYKLKKEFNEVMYYLSSSMHVSNKFFESSPNKNLNFEDLRNIFMTIPKNTSLFALRNTKDLKIVFEKVFHKKYIFHHNQQKMYFKYFLENLFRLFKNHVLLAISNNLSIEYLFIQGNSLIGSILFSPSTTNMGQIKSLTDT